MSLSPGVLRSRMVCSLCRSPPLPPLLTMPYFLVAPLPVFQPSSPACRSDLLTQPLLLTHPLSGYEIGFKGSGSTISG